LERIGVRERFRAFSEALAAWRAVNQGDLPIQHYFLSFAPVISNIRRDLDPQRAFLDDFFRKSCP
jgi:hypothetical protein